MNEKYLDPSEFMPYAPSVVGESVRVKHCHPRNKKMYVTRMNDRVLAYCHHCSKTGIKFNEPQIYKSIRDVSSNRSAWKELPNDMRSLERAKPEWVKQWVDKVECDYADLTDVYGLKYSPSRDSVIIPLNDESYQERTNREVKAITRKNPARVGSVWYDSAPWYRYHNNVILVIVEDPLSAIKVDYWGNQYSSTLVTGLALLSTNMANDLANKIIESKTVKKVVVWLDNDNEKVMKAANKIYNKLSLALPCELMEDTVEPKKKPKEWLEDWGNTV